MVQVKLDLDAIPLGAAAKGIDACRLGGYPSSMNTPLHIVAVRELDGDLEERAAALARVLGLTLFETRARVRPPAPRVVASFAERGAAEALVAALAREAFAPTLLDSDELEDGAARESIRNFERTRDAWRFETRDRRSFVVADRDLRLLLPLSSKTTRTETDVGTKRSFSLGKAMVTGGLMATKKKTIETTTSSVSSEAYVHLYARGQPCFVFSESELQFQGLGAAILPARTANWRLFVQQLRERAPCFDDRLTSRAGQVHVLGGVLDPDRHLDVAITLLTRSLAEP